MKNKIDFEKHIWEGWTVGDFIRELEGAFYWLNDQNEFKTDQQLKDWIKWNQPYYKKHIPDVYKYFRSHLKK